MRMPNKSILLLQLASTALALPSTKRAVQPPKADHGRAHDVKQAFEISWDGYYKNAFPHDTLHPVSNGYADDRSDSIIKKTNLWS